ncbi:MAG: hypothetical protein E6J37_07950 [Chloroflexi bacterium]|nr:MAG: hypothetical protein E6J37_07950 [Chloroflexota bacterium]
MSTSQPAPGAQPTSDAFAVDADNVVKSFGALKALDGVTLRVKTGEIYGLLGPNGASGRSSGWWRRIPAL